MNKLVVGVGLGAALGVFDGLWAYLAMRVVLLVTTRR